MRPLYQKLQHRGFNGNGRPPAKHSPSVPILATRRGRITRKGHYTSRFDTTDALRIDIIRASLNRLYVSWFDNGRTDRASLHWLYVSWFDNGRTDRASLHWLYVSWFDNGRTDRASLHGVIRLSSNLYPPLPLRWLL